jgi:hypothetical protein
VPDDLLTRVDRAGIAVGLAWTPVGGEVLFIEALKTPATQDGGLQLTGMLGDVMLESARIAWSFARGNLQLLGLDESFGKGFGLHLHVPSGAVPKDGPSAGITMATAIFSLLANRRVRPGVAMTGELTLTGKVLAVGGIRDKLLAARRAGIKRCCCRRATSATSTRSSPTAEGLELTFVDRYEQVADAVFGSGAKTRPAKAPCFASRASRRPRGARRARERCRHRPSADRAPPSWRWWCAALAVAVVLFWLPRFLRHGTAFFIIFQDPSGLELYFPHQMLTRALWQGGVLRSGIRSTPAARRTSRRSSPRCCSRSTCCSSCWRRSSRRRSCSFCAS